MVDDWLLASIRHQTSKIFLLMAKACCNVTKIDQKENIRASNLLSLASSDWIIANIYLIAGVAKSWLNLLMWWYQGLDLNVGTPGFLFFYRQVQYFLMLEDLEKIEDSWREMDEFKKLLTMTNPKQKQLKEDMAFVKRMASQVQKHNKQYISLNISSEVSSSNGKLASLCCSAVERRQQNNGLTIDCKINCEKFWKFLQEEIPLTLLDQLCTRPTIQFHCKAINQIAVGLDIWGKTSGTAMQETNMLTSFVTKLCARLPSASLLSTSTNGW
jgi:hypothetical protein